MKKISIISTEFVFRKNKENSCWDIIIRHKRSMKKGGQINGRGY